MIPTRNEIAYRARLMTKNDGKLRQVWTQQGKVYIRPKEGCEETIMIKKLVESAAILNKT